MTMQRDLLTANPAVAEGSTNAIQNSLLIEQSDYLQQIALELRKLNADVLCSAVVLGTSQLSNAITDTNVHEVSFEVGGKPVSIYKLLAFSTYKSDAAALPIILSVLSLASGGLDGFYVPAVSGTVQPLQMPISVRSVWVQIPTLSAANTCAVNGPADSTHGGLYLYGFTIPDYDRIRGSRSY
jgi:hypothetical protein